jgi:hypothetical protein
MKTLPTRQQRLNDLQDSIRAISTLLHPEIHASKEQENLRKIQLKLMLELQLVVEADSDECPCRKCSNAAETDRIQTETLKTPLEASGTDEKGIKWRRCNPPQTALRVEHLWVPRSPRLTSTVPREIIVSPPMDSDSTSCITSFCGPWPRS